jgi:hypothetical protein
VSAYRRVGVSAHNRKIHTEVTEIGKGHKGLKGLRIYEELVFARFEARAYILCAILRPSRPWCGSVIHQHADTPTRRYRAICMSENGGTKTRFRASFVLCN